MRTPPGAGGRWSHRRNGLFGCVSCAIIRPKKQRCKVHLVRGLCLGMGKYESFVVSTIEEKPSKRATHHGDHSMRQYVGITCPYCNKRFHEVVLERLGAKKSSLCKAHIQKCSSYRALLHTSNGERGLQEQVPFHAWSLLPLFYPYFTH